jgi:hypothetical protein
MSTALLSPVNNPEGKQTYEVKGDLIFMKHDGKEVVVHQKIFSHFGKDCIEKVAKNQTIVYRKKS